MSSVKLRLYILVHVSSMNMEKAEIYDLECSQPPGGDQDDLTSLFGSLHVVTLYINSVCGLYTVGSKSPRALSHSLEWKSSLRLLDPTVYRLIVLAHVDPEVSVAPSKQWKGA